MKSDINLSGITKGFGAFFKRFHVILFFLVVSGSLFVAIAMLLSIISLSSTTAPSSDQAVNGAFDEATINRLKSDESAQATPSGRQSPFVE